MKFWHILSRERLEQKRRFAETSGGQLLLTSPAPEKDISNGLLGPFIYLVPTLVGGAVFSDAPELSAICVELKSSAKISKFHGNPDEIPFSSIRETHDGIDMTVDALPAWPVRFRQILLWNPAAVKTWTTDATTETFFSEYQKLISGEMTTQDFFMLGHSREEQAALALSLAKRLGLKADQSASAVRCAAGK